MAKLPVLKPQEVVSRLEALGFVEVRQRGAHKQFRHPDGRGTTVPGAPTLCARSRQNGVAPSCCSAERSVQ